MAKYEWNSPILQKRCTIYNWVALIAMILALVGVLLFSTFDFVGLTCVGVAFVLVILSVLTQSKDKKLKKG